MPKLRLDRLLVDRGLVPSRERAQALILAGKVLVEEQKIEKAGAAVNEDAAIRLLAEDLRYVSRGGLKLEHALAHWKIALAGRTCLDVGASTGGFTDAMLQHGAERVIAIDTGYGQIAAALRNDARVRLLERTNARHLTAARLRPLAGAAVTFLALDVAFISATLVLPAVVESVRELEYVNDVDVSIAGASRFESVVLVKPQFEAGKGNVGKGGIVRDVTVQQAAVERVRAAVAALGGGGIEVIDSPITGTEGNKEFLLHAVFEPDSRSKSKAKSK
ncbi:MAG: TlyA family RNA methyltransferase [Acidobacteriota bacterium]|nr:TlyA family RNA methyltransferase [Acidobacteriota bacterium]